MSKWMNVLLEEIEKNKSDANSPMSALSAPFGGLLEKNYGVLDHKIENLSFQPMSALSAPFGGLLEKLEKNKSIGKLPMSVLSVVGKRVSLRFNNIIKNIYNNPQTPADKADIGSFPRKNSQLVDFSTSFANAIEITRTRNKPKQIWKSRWIAIVERLEVLVRDEKCHLLKMIEHGWSPEEVFGCHKSAPDVRIDGMGLLMLLGSSRIAEIHPEKAVLMFKSGSTTSYYLGAMNRKLSERSTLMEIE